MGWELLECLSVNRGTGWLLEALVDGPSPAEAGRPLAVRPGPEEGHRKGAPPPHPVLALGLWPPPPVQSLAWLGAPSPLQGLLGPAPPHMAAAADVVVAALTAWPKEAPAPVSSLLVGAGEAPRPEKQAVCSLAAGPLCTRG